jgi:hypothetical protein
MVENSRGLSMKSRPCLAACWSLRLRGGGGFSNPTSIAFRRLSRSSRRTTKKLIWRVVSGYLDYGGDRPLVSVMLQSARIASLLPPVEFSACKVS